VTQVPAGWYPDPDPAAAGRSALRYWDGSAWTSHVTADSTPVTPTGPTTPDGEPLAGWWWRVLAYVIDSITVSVVAGIASIPAQMKFQRALEPVTAEWDRRIAQNPGSVDWGAFLSDHIDVWMQNAAWLMGPSMVLTLIYWAVFLKWKGGTPGKLMLGMRVRLRDRAGTLPWSSILGRMLVQFGVVWAAYVVAFATASFAVFLLAALVAVIMLIDPLWATWDDQRQTLHDKLAGTNVVRP
jgi:uncharacterized RDD family membrane protein YckC